MNPYHDDIDSCLTLNGVNGSTGSYAWPAVSPREIAEYAIAHRLQPTLIEELRLWNLRRTRRRRATRDGIDPRLPEQAGWGIIFPSDAPADRLEALAPLTEHRSAAVSGRRFRVFSGPDGYRAGESKNAFLRRHGVGPGPVDPDKMPYYLLLAGSPEEIPFGFQSQLDVAYAVGRVHFDELEDYRRFSEKLCRAESRPFVERPEAAFFAACHRGDRATARSAEQLVRPLATLARSEHAGWEVRDIIGEQATKSELAALLNSATPPHFLLTASHGMVFDENNPRCHSDQGALLCSDWMGPDTDLDQRFYFSAADLTPQDRAREMITFHFACYSGGTPARDPFPHRSQNVKPATRPRLARLPQALLAAPSGGALASVVHVDRAWTSSFLWPGAGSQLQLFTQTIGRILRGFPLGMALEAVHQRYAEISSDLDMEVENIAFGDPIDHREVSRLWTAAVDTRNFLLLGDPATRIHIDPACAQDSGE